MRCTTEPGRQASYAPARVTEQGSSLHRHAGSPPPVYLAQSPSRRLGPSDALASTGQTDPCTDARDFDLH